MAGFNDIAQALQFGAGLVHGFQKQTDEIRAAHDKQQLELLKLLSSDETKNVTPIDPGEVVNTQGFFGGGTLKTREGDPAFKVGGNIFAVKPRPMLGGEETTPTTGVPAPTSAPSVQPLAPLQHFGPTPTAPPVAPAAPAPATQPGLETKAPGGGNTEAIKSYAARKAQEAGLPPDAVLAIMHHESSFNPSATGSVGEVGLMQINPNTMAETGFTAAQLKDPKTNIDAGIGILKRKIAAAGGDINKGIALYNGTGPAAQQYAVTIQGLRGQYKNYAANIPAGTVASVGKPEAPATPPPAQITAAPQPPTATSTPEQDAAYRAQTAQAAAQPAAPAQPDTSMMVAGPGAPGPKTATPAAPAESTIPPPDTVEQRQADAAARVTKQYKGAQTPKEMKEFRQARKEAQDKAETHYGQELREVEKDVKELRSRTHDPRVLDMLDEVKTINQFEHVKKIIKATPEQDFIGQATDYVVAGIAAGKGREAAVHVWKQLERANYSDAKIKDTLRVAGFDKAEEISKAGAIAKQQKETDIAAIPKEQAAKLPGIMEQKRAEQELEISGIPRKQAAEALGLQAQKEREAGIIKPKDDDIPAVNAKMQEAIADGVVDKNISMSDYLKKYPQVLVNIQTKREAAVPLTDLEKTTRTVQNLEAKTGRTPAEEEELRAAKGVIANTGISPEEAASRAAQKTTAVTEAASAAKSQIKGAAQDDVNKILSGETPLPAGMDKYAAATQRLRKDNLQPSDISPQFANEIEDHKDFKRLSDREGWFTPDYKEPSVANIAAAKDQGAVHLSKEEQPRMHLGTELHRKLERIEDNMNKLAEIDPKWKKIAEGQGLPNRLKLNYYQTLKKVTQDNPATAAFMRAIDADLQEIGINYGRFVSGMQGRPAVALIDRTTKNLPTADTSVLAWMKGGKEGLPDNPATMLTQLGLMKDMIRTVQDDTMMQHGGITSEERDKRATKRLDDLAHPERAKQARAMAPAAPAPAAPAPAAPAPAAPAAKSKGQQELDDYLSGGKP